MEYTISVRISFPKPIIKVLEREKGRFVAKHGSPFKSEPHITLYLAQYTKQGFPKLVRALRQLSLRPFTISLLKPKVRIKKGEKKFFFLDVSGKKDIKKLHAEVLLKAASYHSRLLREKDRLRLKHGLYSAQQRTYLKKYGYADVLRLFQPHVTLGTVVQGNGPLLQEVYKRTRSAIGKKFIVSEITAMLYAKRKGDLTATLIEEPRIPLTGKRFYHRPILRTMLNQQGFIATNMSNYLIEGVSGTGKTTVCGELQRRGYKAVEADEEIAHYADPKTGLPTEEKIPGNWIWNEEKFRKALQRDGTGPLFVCGGAMNQEDFKHHFEKVFTLHVDDETLKHRLLTRTNNDFGKHPDELALQLEWNKGTVAYSKERGTILIDATKPLVAVVDEMLGYIE